MSLARLFNVAPVLVTAVALAACGGGGGSDGTSAPSPTEAASSTATLCGAPIGPSVLTGTVTRVHDGDTITVVDHQGEADIRLQGIDAPELAQPFGPESRAALASLLLAKVVRVAYAGSDEYGRLLGAVFTADCTHANLRQVAVGMAWFYPAFQCELPVSLRDAFTHAQQQARAAHAGLWSQRSPQPPWVFRNGHEAQVPECKAS
jgi:endonuclease YncB( thermonuclease family)